MTAAPGEVEAESTSKIGFWDFINLFIFIILCNFVVM